MITIENVTPEEFAALEDRLAATHQATVTPISANTGSISGHGVIASFAYVPASKILTVLVGQHPWYISENAIESNLRKALA